MNTTPIIIPIITPPPTPKCPHCGHNENKKTVCRNCEYEYKEDSGIGTKYVILAILFILFFAYVIVTGLYWIVDGGTLVDLIKSQWKFFVDLLHRIW